MNVSALQRLELHVVLRLRDATVAELTVTPASLFPMNHELLLRRLVLLNRELSRRAADEPEKVELSYDYDPDAPLEDALRPARRPRQS